MRKFSTTILAMLLAVITSISTNVYAQEISKSYDGALNGIVLNAELLGVVGEKSYWMQQTVTNLLVVAAPNEKKIFVFENGNESNSVSTKLELNGKKFKEDGVILTNDKIVLYYIVNESEKSDAGIYIQTYDLNLNNPTTKKIAGLSAGTKLTSSWFGKMSKQDMTVNHDKKSGSFLFTYYFLSDKNDGLSYSRVILTDASFNIVNQYEFAPSSIDKLIKFPSTQFLDNGDAFVSMQELSRSSKKSGFDRLTSSSQLYLPKDGSEYRILELAPQGSTVIGTRANGLINKDNFSTYVIASTDESFSNLYFTVYKYNAVKDEFIDQKVTLPLSKLQGNDIPKEFTFKNISLRSLELSDDGSVYLMLYISRKVVKQSSSAYYVTSDPIAVKINESGEVDWAKYFNFTASINVYDGFSGINTFMARNGDFGFMMNMNNDQFERAKLTETTKNLKPKKMKSIISTKTPNFRMITMDAISGKARFSTLEIPGIKGYFVEIDNTENLGDFTYRVVAKYSFSFNKAKIVEIKM